MRDPRAPSGHPISTPGAYAVPDEALGLERLVFFSDAVFAIAITLLALEIRLPALRPGLTDDELRDQLLAMGPQYFGYALSFMVIGLYWLGHHRMFLYIRHYDRLLLMINFVLLLCIGFVPFPTQVISEYNNHVATIFYALTMAVPGLVSALIWWYALHGMRLLDQPLDHRTAVESWIQTLTAPILLLVSAVLALWRPDLAQVLWWIIGIFAIGMAVRSRRTIRLAAPEAADRTMGA